MKDPQTRLQFIAARMAALDLKLMAECMPPARAVSRVKRRTHKQSQRAADPAPRYGARSRSTQNSKFKTQH